MVKIISLKCPECGADISIEEGHKQCFCQYCGAKIILDDGNTIHTYHKVDEARIKEAEVDKLIRLKELEIEKEERQYRRNIVKYKVIALFVLGIVGTIAFVIDNGAEGRASVVGYTCVIAVMGIVLQSILTMSDNGDKQKK